MDDDILGQAVSVLGIRPDPNNLAKSGFEHWFSQKKSWQNLLTTIKHWKLKINN